MTLDDVKLFFDYGYWANKRVLAAAARVTPQQLDAPSSAGHGSLRGTLLHTLHGEYVWRVLFERGEVMPDFVDAEFATLAAIVARWNEEESALRAFLAGLTDADMTRIVAYDSDDGTPRRRLLWHCLLHLCNHGTHHRGQASAMLRGYGHSPGDLDFTVFLNELGLGRAG